MIDTFSGGCAGVGIKPYPLQFVEDDGRQNGSKVAEYAGFTENKKEATKKLERYWSRLGFKRVKKTAFFFIDLARKRPTAHDLLEPEA